MKVALFNGFTFHYEMYGYIIHYCKERNYNLTIYMIPYLNINDDELDNGHIHLYHQVFDGYNVTYKYFTEFEKDKEIYDKIILLTDNDKLFDVKNKNINKKTISINHYYKKRNDEIFHAIIGTRPFDNEYYVDWALPCYPIIITPIEKNNEIIQLGIIGHTNNYNTHILNRIMSNKTIIIHAFSRNINIQQFGNLDKKFILNMYCNMETREMMNILMHCDYILGDYSDDRYENEMMSGSIPISLSLLVPLIISKQTNKYYNFRNVIEFDKKKNDEIVVDKNIVDCNLLEIERKELFKHNFEIFDKYIALETINS